MEEAERLDRIIRTLRRIFAERRTQQETLPATNQEGEQQILDTPIIARQEAR